ncbi:MAG TPA: hypothetical protein VD902_15345 [Symbiobacteriaceae bacterium]|nr:hypothetical protein [Symbiobacteriaceae bacterium]
METTLVPQAPVQALPQAEAAALARRAAAAKGMTWPAEGQPSVQSAGFTADLTSHPGTEQAVWASPGKEGFLAIFAGGRLVGADKGLGEILRVQPVSLPGLPHMGLMVDDRYDALTGAFLFEERRRIYVWDGRGLRKIYQGILQAEQYRHARWDNPRGPALWRLTRTTGEIALRNALLVERTLVEELEAPGSPQEPLPRPGAFRRVRGDTRERRLMWNARLRRFDEM